MGHRIYAGIGFGFVCPDIRLYFKDDKEWYLIEEFPLLELSASGADSHTRSVVVIKSSHQSAISEPVEILVNSFTVSNEEVDQLSAAKQALGELYADYGYSGEDCQFSHVGWWLFGSYF